MRRIVLVLVVACVAPLLPAPLSRAGTATTDVYRSHFLAHDRAGRAYSFEAVVEDRPAGAQLVLEVRRRCESCRASVYAKALEADEFVSRFEPANPDCQCMTAAVTTKFGGKELRIGWSWDLEQGGSPEGGGYRRAAVTANTLMNVSCFGSGTFTTSPDPFSPDPPPRPKGARPFPDEMPAAFEADVLARPGCHAETP